MRSYQSLVVLPGRHGPNCLLETSAEEGAQGRRPIGAMAGGRGARRRSGTDDGGKIYTVRIIVPAAVSYHDTGSSEALSHFSPVEIIPTTRPLDSMHVKTRLEPAPGPPSRFDHCTRNATAEDKGPVSTLVD